MNKKLIGVIAVIGVFWGCSTNMPPGQQTSTSAPYANINVTEGEGNALVFDPNLDVESALPELRDLPVPSSLKRPKRARQYTGIIKNKTNYDVSVPSGNSGATLVIPAKSWIEYTAWYRAINLTAYYGGKPFYCLKIYANPKAYAFMCQKYDFMVEIVKEEPAPKAKKKVIKRKKKIPKGAGVKGLG